MGRTARKAPPKPAPTAPVSVRWVDHSPSNPVLIDGQPLYLEPGETVDVRPELADELAQNASFQVPAGDWTPPAHQGSGEDTDGGADGAADETNDAGEPGQED